MPKKKDKFKIKENIDMLSLKKLGFIERTFGFYGSGDYLPEIWYVKRYYYKHKEFYIRTNNCFYFSDKYKLLSLELYKDNGSKPDKQIPFNRFYKIARIVLKDLIELGLVKKVEG